MALQADNCVIEKMVWSLVGSAGTRVLGWMCDAAGRLGAWVAGEVGEAWGDWT